VTRWLDTYDGQGTFGDIRALVSDGAATTPVIDTREKRDDED
jgi:hypothetical protein